MIAPIFYDKKIYTFFNDFTTRQISKKIFTLSNAKHGESIGIGLAASSTTKDPQEPMDSINVTYCSIQLGLILAPDGFAKNYMGSRPEAKKCDFFI